jgi:isopentenyl phosphate kinase
LGKRKNLIVIKLGGSVITDKASPLTPNFHNIRLICRQLADAVESDKQLRLFLVHGGGSYGHYYAKKFGLGTISKKFGSPEGIAKTAAAMIELHSLVLEELCRAGVYVGTILPIELFSESNRSVSISENGKSRIESVFENGLFPITFGYVNLEDNRSYIISGDKITIALASSFEVSKTVFVMNVDGIYQSADLRGDIIRELKPGNLTLQSSSLGFDVTGGVKAKISTGFELAELGSEVLFVNGTKPKRLLKALGGSAVVATKIYPTRKSFPFAEH